MFLLCRSVALAVNECNAGDEGLPLEAALRSRANAL